MGENNARRDDDINVKQPRQKTYDHPRNSKVRDEEVQSSYNRAKKHKGYLPSLTGKEADNHYKNYVKLKERMDEWEKQKYNLDTQ